MKSVRNFVLILLATSLLLACNSQPAQEEEQIPEDTFAFAEGHAPVWEQAIIQVMELADAMPEDMYAYKPHDSVRTFAEQLVHMGGSSKVIADLFLNDIQPGGAQPPDASAMSKEEIKQMVKGTLEEVGEMMNGMSDQKLAEPIKSFAGNDMTRLEGLLLVHDHLTNHKAKANLYVRVSGNQPPSYRYY